MFGFLSQHPNQSEKIKPFIALAPVTRVIRPSLSLRLLSRINFVGRFISDRDYLNLNPITHKMLRIACITTGHYLCSNMFFMLMNVKPTAHLNKTRLPVFISHLPGGTSIQNLVHYGQNIKKGKFCKFDWGFQNLLIYGTWRPPMYDLGKIVHRHIVIFSSANDKLATPDGIQFIRNSLRGMLY